MAFASPVNGDKLFLSPEVSMQIQRALNSDIVMMFDECTPYPATRDEAAESMALSLRWARRSRDEFDGIAAMPTRCSASCRAACTRTCATNRSAGWWTSGSTALPIGGLSVGEPKEDMLRILAHIAPRLPADRPRYLMGVGTPEDLVAGVGAGIDMFDCVMPTRNARNGWLFTRFGDIKIRNARYRPTPRRWTRPAAATPAAISPAPTCTTCTGSTRSSARASTRFTTFITTRT